MNRIIKLILITILIITVTINYVFATGIPVVDIVQDILQTSQFIWEVAKETVKIVIDVALNRLKNEIVRSLMDDMLKWIQTGEFGQAGTPSFITNFTEIRKEILNEIQGEIIEELNLTPLCSPLQFNAQIFVKNILGTRNNQFRNKFYCTFEEIFGNIEDFLNQVQNNNWFAYYESINPANTTLGFYINIQNEIASKNQEKTETKTTELQTGQGFLSKKQCLNYVNKDGKSTALGNLDLTKEQIENALKNPSAYPDIIQKIEEENIRCKNYEILTPGSIVAESVKKSVGSDLDYIINSTDLSDFIAKAIDLGLKRLFDEGLKYIKDSKQITNQSLKYESIQEYNRSKEEENKNNNKALRDLENINFTNTLISYVNQLENASSSIINLTETLNLLLECQSSSPNKKQEDIESTLEKINYLNSAKEKIPVIITNLNINIELIRMLTKQRSEMADNLIIKIKNDFEKGNNPTFNKKIIEEILNKVNEIKNYVKETKNNYNCNLN